MSHRSSKVTRAAQAAPSKKSLREKGSAVLVASMVTAVLALMGIAYLTLSETETQIAVNRRDAEQVLSIAESGVNLVVTWFNNPNRSLNPLLPEAADVDRTLRLGDSNYDGMDDIDAPTNGAPDFYRGGRASGGYRIFDRPFRGARWDTFWGSSDNPDILIVDDESIPDEYLDEVNALFNPSNDPSLGQVQISEIRIYAPPMDQTLRTRFGIATIEVTAVKHRRWGSADVSARQTVLAVLSEIPYPLPIGAIESEGMVDENGNFGAHWGGTSTEGDLDTTNGGNFPGPSVPRVEGILQGGWADFSPDAPDLDAVTMGTQNLLTQLMASAGIPDPWLVMICDGEFADAVGNPDEQPWPYDYFARGVDNDISHAFHHQDYEFPSADYEIWKAIAQMPLPSVRYFMYSGLAGGGDPIFREDGTSSARKFQEWINLENTQTGTDPAFFFFETANAANPQNGGPGILTPPMNISSGDIVAASGDFYTAGFIYINAAELATSGISAKGLDVLVNPPPEHFLDEGVDLNGSGIVGDSAAEAETVGNGWWDFDLDDDGESDADRYAEVFGTADFLAMALAHEFAAGVLPHAGADPRILASQPHEPFLNLAWRDVDEIDFEIPIDFDHEGTFTRFTGYDLNDDGAEDRTTTLWDLRGAKLTLIRTNLNGVLYSEGAYDGSGNLNAYGSVFFRAGFNATGSPNIYFNAEILRGNFPFNEWNLPRVYITAMTTNDS